MKCYNDLNFVDHIYLKENKGSRVKDKCIHFRGSSVCRVAVGVVDRNRIASSFAGSFDQFPTVTKSGTSVAFHSD